MADVRPIDANALQFKPGVLYDDQGFSVGNVSLRQSDIDAAPTLDYAPRQQWISVKERWPEDCIDQSKDVKQIKVMVAIKAKNGWTVRTQMRCKDVHSRFYGASPDIIWYWRHFSAGEITHWMPLPEQPKEE